MKSEELQGAAEACAGRHGAYLIDLAFRGERGSRVLALFVDTPAGVTTSLCAEISRDLSETLDREKLVDGAYRLEVSSPGVDRPLKFPWQFGRHVGRNLEVRTKENPNALRGVLRSAGETGIVLETPAGGKAVAVGYDAVVEARVKTPW